MFWGPEDCVSGRPKAKRLWCKTGGARFSRNQGEICIPCLCFRTLPGARAVVVKFGDGSAIQLHILLLLDTYTFLLHMPWDLPSERNVIGGLRWLFPLPDLKNKRLNVILWKILDEIQQGNAAKMCVKLSYIRKKAPTDRNSNAALTPLYPLKFFQEIRWFLTVVWNSIWFTAHLCHFKIL